MENVGGGNDKGERRGGCWTKAQRSMREESGRRKGLKDNKRLKNWENEEKRGIESKGKKGDEENSKMDESTKIQMNKWSKCWGEEREREMGG